MDKTSLINKIKEFGLNTKEEYTAEAFSRNIGLLTQADQDKLANATVAIPGMGGVGGVHLITMTRTGVGKFHLADFDVFEPANVNRQRLQKTARIAQEPLERKVVRRRKNVLLPTVTARR